MTDKEIMDEFTKLYTDYQSLDNALIEIYKMISAEQYSRLIDGLARLRK